ncbi:MULTISPECIES: RNA polymerase sigma factor SigF [Nocardia]|uniref:RNA polymerase sigma factor SigF n=1 Tax=Nocardia aurea TaxID=2144174 RepID=A0ABV3FZM6_9NOCA|nr:MULTISPECIES: RNA polymerase sigma factor SigF [Nocardia]
MADSAEPRSRPEQRRSHSGTESYDNLEPMFARLAEFDPDDPARAASRQDIIERCLPLAANIARRFSGRGENYDDLLQIARVGMVQAVDRFDPSYGASFLSFAVPTIMGEVRRHFRDHTWAVRVPRRLKEIQQTIGPATEKLTHELGRMPRAREIAEEIGAELTEVTQALIARNAYQSTPIDPTPEGGDSDNTPASVLDTLGADDTNYDSVEDYLAVRPLIAALPERQRQVLVWRFFDSLTQIEIAERLGCSQMQVSRILTKTLSSLREQAMRD